MFKSRGMNAFMIIIVLAIIATVAIFFITSNQSKGGETTKDPSIDEIVNNLTVETGEITTNIKGDHYVKVNFNVQVSSKTTKDELTKRLFQVKNAVIYTVSGMTVSELQDQKGITSLEKTVADKINKLLTSGTVTHVYTTERIVQ